MVSHAHKSEAYMKADAVDLDKSERTHNLGELLLIGSIHWLTVVRSSATEKEPKLAILTRLKFHSFPAAVITGHHRKYRVSNRRIVSQPQP